MEGLSNEMLLAIFAHVADAGILLDVIPLVCRRWRDLARDPAAWTGVDLTLEDTTTVAASKAQCRVLLHAPALRNLILDVGLSCTDARVSSALRRTNVRVTGTLRAESEDNHTRALLDLLSRSQLCLRGLTQVNAVDMLSATDSDGCSLWTILARIKGLESLKLNFFKVNWINYDGELSHGLPSLRYLYFSTFDVDKCPSELGAALVQIVEDLLRGAASSLTHLIVVLPAYQLLSVGLLDALANCTSLTHLSLSEYPTPAVLQRLTKLHIYRLIVNLDLSIGDESLQQELCRFRCHLQHCLVLESLSRLDIEVRVNDTATDEHGVIGNVIRPTCESAVASFEAARPGVVVSLRVHHC